MLCNGFGRIGVGPSDIGSSEYSKRLIIARRILILMSAGKWNLASVKPTCRTHVRVSSHNVLSLERSWLRRRLWQTWLFKSEG